MNQPFIKEEQIRFQKEKKAADYTTRGEGRGKHGRERVRYFYM